MNELALFAGAGGGILGGILNGWRTVCAVEINDYCRRVLMQRQDDGILEPFPIWSDVLYNSAFTSSEIGSMDKKYRYGTERACVICGVLFKPRDKDSAQTCCSNKCRGVLQTQRASKECAVCGKFFKPTRKEYQTCSRQCGLQYKASRKEIDPMVEIRHKLAVFCCSLITRCLRNKTDRTAALLGYTVEDLRSHLESHFEPGMGWHNYGKQKNQWSIDHVRPISTFPMTATLLEINALANLKPMWHSANCAKKNKWESQ